ncbi:MAG: hypothetical protein KGI51_08445 [Rhodospirillales bacterium]|nr:hypothetical protein [Rhodospirillales bacterium]
MIALKPVTMTLPGDLIEALDTRAEADGRSRSGIARLLLTKAIFDSAAGRSAPTAEAPRPVHASSDAPPGRGSAVTVPNP